ncbi:MAG: DegV family EDD domain-containing protein [Proteobacteria bacterium]|nr:DegV family EDD domain-containing protein [Pseudomonadota bacterium]
MKLSATANRRPIVAIRYLDGHRLSRALRAGMLNVIADQDRLNRINVFPVPDGDTGTNLTLTMRTMIGALKRKSSGHIGKTLITAADAALDGARGNSGAILAQFFQGLCDSAAEYPILNTRQFSTAVASGAQYAAQALQEPVEGTILTVLRDYSNAVANWTEKRAGSDFIALLHHGLEQAKRSLANTPKQLAALRKAGVVDAGGQGFVDLLQGIHDFVASGSLRPGSDLPEIEEYEPGPGAGEVEDLEYRYCTECMVSGTEIDRRKLREQISELGNSMVIAGTHRKVKIHIHVNHPQEVFERAGKFGRVSASKADDMHKQQLSAHARGKVAVIADSAADIPDDQFEKLNIHMVPVQLHFGNRTYLDKVSITADEFLALLESHPEHPQTSQPAPGDFRRQFEFLCSHYAEVISISVTGAGSGTYQAALAAARRLPGKSITCIDSRNISIGEGLVAMYAAECAQAGLDGDRLVRAIEEIIPKTRAYALLGDIEYTVRGGRVSRWVKQVAGLLRISPIITADRDGKVTLAGFLPGRTSLVRKFHRFACRKMKPGKIYRIVVGHAGCPERANRLLKSLHESLPDLHSVHLAEVGSGIACHGGPGTLALGIQEYDHLPGAGSAGRRSPADEPNCL